MGLDLLKLTVYKQSIHPQLLIDGSVREIEKKNHRSLYGAWLCDWGLALFLSFGLVTTWIDFIQPLVFSYISPSSVTTFIGSSASLTWILASLVNFSLSYFGLVNGGQTFGMKIVKHIVSYDFKELSWQQSLKWSMGSIVSLMSLGLTVRWLDDFALTTTTTQNYFHWKFAHQNIPASESPIDLLAVIESGVEAEFEEAKAA